MRGRAQDLGRRIMASSLLGKGPRSGPTGFFVGGYAVLHGLGRVLFNGQFRKLMMVPMAITLVLYLVLGLATLFYGPGLLADLIPRPDGPWFPDEQWFNFKLLFWFFGIILAMGVLFGLMILLFATVAEAVGGSFYEKMSKIVLEEFGVKTFEVGLIAGSIPDLIRSLAFVIPGAFLGLLGLLPGVGLPFMVLGSVIVWLGFASGAFNPALQLTQHKLGERVFYVFRNFSTALGIGSLVGLSMLVPVLGLVAIPASIVGASELYAASQSRS